MQCWIFGVLPLLKCTSINSVNREVTHKSIDLIPPHHVISNPAPLELLLKTYVLKLHNRLNSSRFGNLSVIHQAFSMKYVYKANRLWASNLQPPAVALYTSASPWHRLPPSSWRLDWQQTLSILPIPTHSWRQFYSLGKQTASVKLPWLPLPIPTNLPSPSCAHPRLYCLVNVNVPASHPHPQS